MSRYLHRCFMSVLWWWWGEMSFSSFVVIFLPAGLEVFTHCFFSPWTLKLLMDALPFLLFASYISSLKLFVLKSPLLAGSFLVWVLFVDFSDLKCLPLPCDGFVLNLYTTISINFSIIFLDQPYWGRSIRLPTLGQKDCPFLFSVIWSLDILSLQIMRAEGIVSV